MSFPFLCFMEQSNSAVKTFKKDRLEHPLFRPRSKVVGIHEP